IDIQHRERIGSDGEFNRLFLSGLEADARESFQFLDRTRHRSYSLMDVHLRHFVTLPRAGVGYVYADPGGTAGVDLWWINAKIFKFETRVAEAVAEWEQRFAGAEFVAAIRRGLVVVEIREVPDGMRESNGQLASGIHVTK